MATIIDDGRFRTGNGDAAVSDEFMDKALDQQIEMSLTTGKPKRKYVRKAKVLENSPLVEAPQEHSELGPITNGASAFIAMQEPWAVRATIRGVSPILWHRWNTESIEEKAAAGRGSAIRKTDDVESYVYRDENGFICVPGEYVRQSILGAAKRISDPTNIRKRALDLFKASIICTTELAPLLVDGKPCKEWELLDRRRVRVQQAGITRSRPSFYKGWTAEFTFLNLSPDLISFDLLHDRLISAGRLDGIADFRPTYGRFSVTSFALEDYTDTGDY